MFRFVRGSGDEVVKGISSGLGSGAGIDRDFVDLVGSGDTEDFELEVGDEVDLVSM